MSTTTQVTTFNDLYTDLQNRVRVQTGVTATENQAKRAINIGLQDMHIGFAEKMTWAERDAVLVTQQDYTTGTATIAQGSTALTGIGTAWATNNAFGLANMRAGGKIVIDGGVEVYEIASVTNDTGAVLASAFIKADAAATSYRYFEDEYALDADFLRPVDQQSFDTADTIELIGRNEFRRRYPRSNVTGKPMVATILDKSFAGSTTPVRKVRFWQPPDDFYSIPYAFITNKLAVASDGTEQESLSADTDEPIVPLRYRHAIVFHALYHWYRDKKDDNRSAAAKAEYVDVMLRVTGDQEIGRSRPQLRPQVSPYASAARSPYRTRSSRHVTGTRFDRLR